VLAGTLLLPTDTALAVQPPGIEGTPPRSVIAGREYFYQPDIDQQVGKQLTYHIHNRPSWATFRSNNGRLFGTPMPKDVGTYHDISIEVHEGNQIVAATAFWIRVDPYSLDNEAPKIWRMPDRQVASGTHYRYLPKSYDPDGHSLTFAIVNKPSWAHFNRYSGLLNGRPGPKDKGSYPNIRIKATDGKAVTLLPLFSIDVVAQSNANRPPLIVADLPRRVVVGNQWAVKFDANDPDGDPLVFAIENKPDWMEFWSNSGWLVGTPQWVDIGVYPKIRVMAMDGRNTVATRTFSIHVDPKGARNAAPSIVGTPAVIVGKDRSILTSMR
jgi:hypothetical protein